MKPGQFIDFQGGHDFVGQDRAFDDAFLQRLRHLGDRHADRRRTERRQHFRRLPRGGAYLHALQVGAMHDRLLDHVEYAAAVQVKCDQMHILEFVRIILLHVVPQRLARGFGVMHDERQLEDLHQRKAARGIACDRPDDVHDAVLDLVVQLRHGAAKLHRRIDLAFDAALRFGGDFRAPRFQHLLMRGRRRRQRMVHFEHDFLRLNRKGAQQHRGTREHSQPLHCCSPPFRYRAGNRIAADHAALQPKGLCEWRW